MSTLDKIPVMLYGFGFIGRMLARALLKLKQYDIVGVIDINPKIVGHDIGDILGTGKTGVIVSNNPEKVIRNSKPRVILHATTSFLNQVFPQIKTAIEHGANIISSCETLAYPWYRYPELAKELDKLAKKHEVTVLSAGVNPGFIFDTLPLIISGSCLFVKRIKVIRKINALKRRLSFQRKIGLGIPAYMFDKLLNEGKITGHVGYAESAMIIAKTLGFKLSKIVEKQEPIIFNNKVIGIKGYAAGYSGKRKRIYLEFIASANLKDQDIVVLECENYKIRWVSGGTPGDQATISVMLSFIPTILKSESGLKTVADFIPFRTPVYS
ncbi:MAG: dihydrodipicolinate reductase [Thermoprotei archaeon]|nr:MAG: dihydrodipicolinate reductase [Thermoprotei archaeon]